jgi:hypothetical protein
MAGIVQHSQSDIQWKAGADRELSATLLTTIATTYTLTSVTPGSLVDGP